jgi:hypothetical protein
MCLGQNCSIQWRVNSINVAFSDQNLASDARTAIVADLQNCFQGWAANAEIMLRIKDESSGYMYYGTRNPYYGNGVDFPRNIITLALGGVALQIPKDLSDAYTNAFAFAAANSNAVAAAHDFVAFVSSSLVKEMPRQYYQAEFSGIVEGLFQYPKYYPPSLLGFYCSTNGPGTNNLYLRLPAKTNPGYGYDEWDGFPAIWHDNKWKICLGYEWIP